MSNIKTGLVIISKDEVFMFSSLEYNFIFSIEVIAIIRYLDLIKNNLTKTNLFLIASDSFSTISAINNHNTLKYMKLSIISNKKPLSSICLLYLSSSRYSVLDTVIYRKLTS